MLHETTSGHNYRVSHSPVISGIRPHTSKIWNNEVKAVFSQDYIRTRKIKPNIKIFYLQLESKSKSNWAATCLNNLRDMKIAKSLKEITEMTTKSYKAMIKTKCNELAFQYLMNKRGTKGKDKLGLSCAKLRLASAKLHTSLSSDQLKLATN